MQNQLHSCGYFNPFVEATASHACYARSLLPGCKAPYIQFERLILERWYTAVFGDLQCRLKLRWRLKPSQPLAKPRLVQNKILVCGRGEFQPFPPQVARAA